MKDEVAEKRAPKARASSASVRRVEGGFIVSYQIPYENYAALQQQSALTAHALGGDMRDVVCTEFRDVSALLAQLLGVAP